MKPARTRSLVRSTEALVLAGFLHAGLAKGAALTWTTSNPANTVWTAANVWDGPTTWVNGDSATFTNSPTVNLGTAISQTGVTISSGQTLTLNLTADSKLTGTGAFSGNLTKTGTTLRLSHSGGFSGILTANAGNVVFGSTNTDPTGQTSSATKLVASGGAFILGSAYNLGSMTIGELSGTSGSVRTDWADGGTNGKRTLIVDQSTDTTYSGTFNEGTSGRTFDLIKSGAGILTLSGNSNSSWTGGNAIITGGTLKLGHAHGMGGNGSYAQGFTLRNGALDINGQTNFTFTGGSAAWLVNAEGITLGGQTGGVMEIKNTGASAGFSLFNFNNAITYDATNNPGTATVSANWYGTGASGVVTKNLTVGDSSATSVELDFTGQMGQTAVADGYQTTLVKLGAGAMRISAANYFPRLQVEAGTLIVNHANALGASRTGGYSNLVTVNGGTLDLNGFSNNIGALAGTGGVISTGVAGTSTLSAGGSGADTSYSGTIQNGSGTVALTKQGAGVLSLSGTNSYSGGTTIQAGTINWNNNSALGSATVTLNNASTGGSGTGLNRNGAGTLANNIVVANLGTGAVTIGNATGATSVTYNGTLALGRTTRLEAGNAAGTVTFNGVISGAGGIVKLGAGTVVLASPNSFTGSVSVEAGTLVVPTGNELGLGANPPSFNAGQLTLNGGTLQVATTSLTINDANRGLTIGSNSGTFNVDAGLTLSVSSPVNASAAGEFIKAGAGTFALSNTGSTPVNVLRVTGGGKFAQSAGTITIQTAGISQGLLVDDGEYRLEAGTLRTDRITVATGELFTWGAGTLTMRQQGATVSGTGPDRSVGNAGGPVVKEGTVINVTGDLSTSAGSILDLGPMYNSGDLLHDRIAITGTLDLSSSDDTLVFGVNPYFLRPTSPSSVYTGDWGTLRLVTADFVNGEFDTVTVGTDAIGWRLFTPGQNGDPAFVSAGDLPLNTYYVENIGSGYSGSGIQAGGVVLFHYKVAGSVPEPASAGLLVAGALLLRALNRKSAR